MALADRNDSRGSGQRAVKEATHGRQQSVSLLRVAGQRAVVEPRAESVGAAREHHDGRVRIALEGVG